MNESLRKHMVCLGEPDSQDRIGALVEAGMRVALLEAALPPQQLDRLKADVLEVFARRNTPIGLLLRLRPEDRVPDLQGFQYLLLSGFDPAAAAELIRCNPVPVDWLVEEPSQPEEWRALVDGIVTRDPIRARDCRLGFSLVVLAGDDAQPADGVLWPLGTSPGAMEAASKALPFDAALLEQGLAAAQGDPHGVTACLAVRCAVETGAAAILALTADGSNLPAITRLHPPVPVIAVAGRPAGEGMLLRQTLRYGVLPTAISKIPEDPREAIPFARWVAQLYGYQPGTRFVVTGHWLPEENGSYLETITL